MELGAEAAACSSPCIRAKCASLRNSSIAILSLLCPVVESFVLPKLDAWQDLALGCFVSDKLAHDDHMWHAHEIRERPTDGLLGGDPSPAVLHQDVENRVVLVNGLPKVVLQS